MPLPGDLTWGGAALLLLVILIATGASVVAVAVVFAKLPPTFFQDFHSREVWGDRHVTLRLTARIVRNALGAVLVALGVVLSLPGVPGPGLPTILIGIILLEFPGKRQLERRIVGRRRLLRMINRLRRRFGEPPLILGARRGRTLRRHHETGESL